MRGFFFFSHAFLNISQSADPIHRPPLPISVFKVLMPRSIYHLGVHISRCYIYQSLGVSFIYSEISAVSFIISLCGCHVSSCLNGGTSPKWTPHFILHILLYAYIGARIRICVYAHYVAVRSKVGGVMWRNGRERVEVQLCGVSSVIPCTCEYVCSLMYQSSPVQCMSIYKCILL